MYLSMLMSIKRERKFMDKEVSVLSKYRYEKAREEIKAASMLLNDKLYASSLNRSYYAIFHSVRSLFAFIKIDSKTHNGIKLLFDQNYIKTGLIEKMYSEILRNAFIIRQKSDYNDFYIASKAEAEKQIQNAKLFMDRINKYINENYIKKL